MKSSPEELNSRYVSVRAPARLHLGFLDMQGGLNRKFGSLGLAVNGVDVSLIAEYADDIDIVGPSSERATNYAEQVLSHFGINGGVKMEISSAIPEHAGLGSGTQLSLAVASAICHLYQVEDRDPAKLATILHRGARSGIGIGTFNAGGFIVDGGRGDETDVPPVISRLDFPEHWRVIMIFDDDSEGINGVPERRAFNTLPPMTEDVSGQLCRLTLMQVLPAIKEANCELYGNAITQIQNITGDYFAQAQGGRYTSPLLEPVLESLIKEGAQGVGQSSWGPTGFAFFHDETIAFQALKKIREDWQQKSQLRFMLTDASNKKASISVSDTRPGTNIKKSNKDNTMTIKTG